MEVECGDPCPWRGLGAKPDEGQEAVQVQSWDGIIPLGLSASDQYHILFRAEFLINGPSDRTDILGWKGKAQEATIPAGRPAHVIALNVSANTVSVSVTAENGTTQDYTTSLHRMKKWETSKER